MITNNLRHNFHEAKRRYNKQSKQYISISWIWEEPYEVLFTAIKCLFI